MNQFNKTFGLLFFKFEYKFENISWWTIMVFLAVLWFILLTNIRNLQVCKFWILTFIYWIHGHTHIQTCTNTCTHIIHTHTQWYYFHFLLSTELSWSSISVEIFFKRANHDKRFLSVSYLQFSLHFLNAILGGDSQNFLSKFVRFFITLSLKILRL